MSRFKSLALTGLVVVAISLGWVGLANAHSFHSGTSVTLSQGQSIHESVFAGGRTIDIDNEVFGDIFCAGQTVHVSGVVHGDVLCAGQTVNVSGKVDGDVRLAGQTVTLGATVAGNATVAGQSFTLESGSKIGGDLTIGSTDAVINGVVGRDMAVGGDSVTITGEVGRNIKGSLNTLTLSSRARVNGDINYTSTKDLTRDSGATVSGTIKRTEPVQPNKSKHWAVFGFGIWWFVYWFASMLLTAMVIALLFPRMLQSVTDKAMPNPWKAALTGFLANAALPFVLILLAITVIGIPLALMVMLLWFVVLLLSGPLFGYYLGRLILPDSKKPLLIMLLGASILLVLYFIPIVGFLALLAVMWLGSGMLLLDIFQRTPTPTYDLEASPVKK